MNKKREVRSDKDDFAAWLKSVADKFIIIGRDLPMLKDCWKASQRAVQRTPKGKRKR